MGHAGWARILGLVAFGYLLIGVTAASFGVPGARSTVILYLVAYVATPLGAFTIVRRPAASSRSSICSAPPSNDPSWCGWWSRPCSTVW
jgi:hypothetical protein